MKKKLLLCLFVFICVIIVVLTTQNISVNDSNVLVLGNIEALADEYNPPYGLSQSNSSSGSCTILAPDGNTYNGKWYDCVSGKNTCYRTCVKL
jgi:hypothetical protein